MTKYESSFNDELDWSLLNQLHNVVLQISKNSFQTKQLCLTVLVGIVGLLIKFTNESLTISVFVAGLLIPLSFWILDSIGFFYQVKLRGTMDIIRENLAERNKSEALVGIKISEVIEDERVEKHIVLKIFDALFNNSMWLYYILLAADLILWGFYNQGLIW